MDRSRLMQWIEAKQLSKYVKKTVPHLTSVLKNNLNTKRSERLTILADLGLKERRLPAVMAASYMYAADQLKVPYNLVLQRPAFHHEHAGENVISELLNNGENNVIAIAVSGKLGSMRELGRSFRTYVKNRKHRFVSTTSLAGFSTEGYKYLLRAIDVNYREMAERGKCIQKALDDGQEVHVQTRRGTDLFYSIKGMKALHNNGLYHAPSSGGNIPAGEVYIPCRDNKVEGTLVIDGSLRTTQRNILLKKPVKLTIEKGSVTEINGNGIGKQLENSFIWAEQFSKKPENVRRIGELGIGTNPRAKVIGPTIINEKSLGTAHIAIGSNHWMGGTVKSIIHLDQVFYDPLIEIDGKLLNGSFLS